MEKETKKVAFMDEPVTRLFIFIFLCVLGGIYFVKINPWLQAKGKCEGLVQYVPAQGEKKYEGTLSGYSKPSVAEHYTWNGSKFESREAATKYCIAVKTKK